MTNQKLQAQKIRNYYTDESSGDFEKIKALNKKVKTPARVFSYAFSTVGSLILGTGMCLAMGVIGASLAYAMPLGIAVGCVGILIAAVNYPIHKRILRRRKKKYSAEILSLTDKFLCE